MTSVSRLTERLFAEGLFDLFGREARSEQARKRIICDCQETLFNNDSKLNRVVFDFLVQAKRAGYEIVLASANRNLSQLILDDILEEAFREHDLPSNYFGQVQAKNNLTGTAYIIIDDKPDDGYIRILSPRHILKPDDERIPAMTRQLKIKQGLSLEGEVPRKRA